MSYFPILLIVYLIGILAIGIPMGIWSLRAWRKRDGKKYGALALLFPWNYLTLDDKSLRQGYGTYESGSSLLHSMVSSDALLNSIYDEDTASRLACARYIFVSALTWPLRYIYLVVMGTIVVSEIAFLELFINILPTLGGKFLLQCKRCLRF